MDIDKLLMYLSLAMMFLLIIVLAVWLITKRVGG